MSILKPSKNKIAPVWVCVDVESNGPCPGLYSMTSFGAVVVEEKLNRTFAAGLNVIPGALVDPEAAKIDQSTYVKEDPAIVMPRFVDWVESLSPGKRVTFVSDNVAFDWMFVNYYVWRYVGRNPFGWSGRRIGDLYCGMIGDTRASWKHLRKTTHDHDPLNDAKGNAEALIAILEKMKQARGPQAR